MAGRRFDVADVVEVLLRWQTLVLGLVAGATILIGLPIGRMRSPRPRLRQFLSSLAIGSSSSWSGTC